MTYYESTVFLPFFAPESIDYGENRLIMVTICERYAMTAAATPVHPRKNTVPPKAGLAPGDNEICYLGNGSVLVGRLGLIRNALNAGGCIDLWFMGIQGTRRVL